MPQSQSLELDVTFGQGVLIKFHGVGHYKVGAALNESGLLVSNGFQSVDNDTAAIIVRDGVSPTEAVILATATIEELVASGEIQLGA
jgi:hypothetical protein